MTTLRIEVDFTKQKCTYQIEHVKKIAIILPTGQWYALSAVINDERYSVLAIQDFEFGTLPWHLVIRVKFGTCVQS